jgi:hypothetical protein
MWAGRFKEFLYERLSSGDYPDIVKVEQVQMADNPTPLLELHVTDTDGNVWVLMTVRSSPPGGEDFTQPEVIVTKGSVTATGK